VNNPIANSEGHPDIQEILRKRRETLNRVKADLERVGKLQQEFSSEGESGNSEKKSEGK